MNWINRSQIVVMSIAVMAVALVRMSGAKSEDKASGGYGLVQSTVATPSVRESGPVSAATHLAQANHSGHQCKPASATRNWRFAAEARLVAGGEYTASKQQAVPERRHEVRYLL